MRAVNLLPRQTSAAKHGIDRTLIVAVALTLVVGAAIMGGFFLEKAQAATERQRMVAAQAALSKAESRQPTKSSPGPGLLQIPVVLSQQEPWHIALDAAISSRVAWDVFLRNLEYVVPDRISLTSVSLGSSGSGTTGTADGSIALGGTAFSSQDLAVFLSTLARVPNVSQVTLVSSNTNVGTHTITFQITAVMNLPAPPAPPATGATATTTTPTGA